MRRYELRVPEEVHAAVRAEAGRQLRPPGDVLTDFLRACWPDYVAGRIRADFTNPHAGPVIDVSSRPDRQALPVGVA